MNFYTQQHKYYCGIDLHARKMFVCILNQQRKVVIHQNITTNPNELLELISPYVEDRSGGGRRCKTTYLT